MTGTKYRTEALSKIVSKVNHNAYGEYWEDEDGESGLATRRQLLATAVLADHIENRQPISVYPIPEESSKTSVLVFDLDDKKGGGWTELVAYAKQIVYRLRGMRLNTMIFKSGGGKGLHIWVVFDEPQEARKVRRAAQYILNQLGLRESQKPLADGGVAIFPKQETIESGSLGNPIALPLARHSAMLDDSMSVLDADDPDNWTLDNPSLQFDVDDDDLRQGEPLGPAFVDTDKGLLSEAMKSALEYLDETDYDDWVFVGHCVKSKWPGDEGFEAWTRWSAKAPNFLRDDRKRRDKWDSFKTDRITLRSLFYHAVQRGWKPTAGLYGPIWTSKLVRNRNGNIKPTLSNAITIVENCDELKGALHQSEFDLAVMLTRSLPGDHPSLKIPRQLTDNDVTKIAVVCESYEWQGTAISTIERAIQTVAERNTLHPIRSYMDAIEWDGVARVDGWLARYWGANDGAFERLVGPKILIGAIARIYEPGCKVDNVPIFEGPQGAKKTTAIRIMAGRKYHVELVTNFESKDTLLIMQGAWVCEVAELTSLSRSEYNAVKAILTRTEDKFRAPYGRAVIDHPRCCVFWGTTNPEGTGYLKDPTGNRRYWPIAVNQVDIQALTDDREQLWAEAVHRYKNGEAWWLTDSEQDDLAAGEQKKRALENPYIDKIIQLIFNKRAYDSNGEYYWAQRGEPETAFTMDEVIEGIGLKITDKARVQSVVGNALKEIGFIRDENRKYKKFRRPDLSNNVRAFWYRLPQEVLDELRGDEPVSSNDYDDDIPF